MNEVDIADEINEWDDVGAAVILFRLMPKDLSAEVFAYLDPDAQRRIVEGITDSELRGIIDELFLDDTVDFLEEMPSSIVRRVMRVSDKETRDQINRFLSYPEDSAGSLMTPEMLHFHADWTVGEALAHLRRNVEESAAITQLYVVDSGRKLIGGLTLRDLLGSKDPSPIRDILDENVVSVKTTDDQADVADLFKKYDLTAMPVTDKEDRLVGVITIDDVVDVMEEETTEDIYKMAAMEPIEDSYMETGVFTLARKRVVWLVLLMISATFTSLIIQHYEMAFQANLLLTSFIPMLMDTSGNAGSQASVSIIRSLTLGEVEFKDILTVIWKEVRIAVLVGVVVSALNFLRIWLFNKDVLVALTVSLAMLCSITAAKVVGCSLPLLAAKCKLDPALMASPMITTIVDVVALLAYFNIALLVIPGL